MTGSLQNILGYDAQNEISGRKLVSKTSFITAMKVPI